MLHSQQTLETISIAMKNEPHQCHDVLYSEQVREGISIVMNPINGLRIALQPAHEIIPIAINCINGLGHALQPATREASSIAMNRISDLRHALQPANS